MISFIQEKCEQVIEDVVKRLADENHKISQLKVKDKKKIKKLEDLLRNVQQQIRTLVNISISIKSIKSNSQRNTRSLKSVPSSNVHCPERFLYRFIDLTFLKKIMHKT